MLREELPSCDDGLPRYQDQEHRVVALDYQDQGAAYYRQAMSLLVDKSLNPWMSKRSPRGEHSEALDLDVLQEDGILFACPDACLCGDC